jgi:hypothetical protein
MLFTKKIKDTFMEFEDRFYANIKENRIPDN